MDQFRLLFVLVLLISILSIAFLALKWYKARTVMYYIVIPPIMFVGGFAFAWAYEVSEPNLIVAFAIISALMGIQGAWILTTRIPR
jgi:hypothetical protein